MVKQYYSTSLSLLLLLIASSLLFVVSLAEEDMKGAPNNSTEEEISILPQRHASITNDLGQDILLRIHCKSKNDDLGSHDLSFHSTFHWDFKTNALTKNTLFYCYVWWGKVESSFNAYDAARDDDNCTDCKWSIRTDGAYWYNSESNKWDRLYQWTKP
ncbi:hypothetical protein QN277_028751 [Acacia crassicarpa]|uniref:S-protein homolog n=1 Tax=Acacia crassicarpa TaxID=499986 RepID=A0AAE1MK46_9FABA|nr:hypothetical protein QN277_028751 [Acacia crassicarpa]